MEIMSHSQRDLPNSTLILVLGILSLVFFWLYGIIGLILGIVTVVMAKSQRKAYFQSPSEYTESSFKNVNTGRICGIIAICISAFAFLFWILVLLGIVALGWGVATMGL